MNSRIAKTAAVVLFLSYAQLISAQIVLPPPNISGTIGLENETFAFATVTARFSGISRSDSLNNGETTFAITVDEGIPFSITASMSGFSGVSGGSLNQHIKSLPALLPGETRVLDLTRPSGRVAGTATVLGGQLLRISLNLTQDSPAETVFGFATSSQAPFVATLPMPAGASTTARGTATVLADAGCEIPVSLASQVVTVPNGGTANVNWSVDVSAETCATGSLQGNVALNGVPASATLHRHTITAFGRSAGTLSKSTQLTADGSYAIAGLNAGQYTVGHHSQFLSPFGSSWLDLNFSTNNQVSVLSGETTTVDFNHDVGAISGRIQPSGLWSIDDVSSASVNFRGAGPGNSTYNDSLTSGSGQFDIVALSNDAAWLNSFNTGFFELANDRSIFQSFALQYFTQGSSPVQGTPGTGATLDLGIFSPEVSQSEVVFQAADPATLISRLTVSGNRTLFDENNNAIGRILLNVHSNLSGGGSPTNIVSMTIRGLPGTYTGLSVQADTASGDTLGTLFDLTLGDPQGTLPCGGTSSIQCAPESFETPSGLPIGTIQFETVTDAGDTSISLSSSGPQPPSDFEVSTAGLSLYYDISTTAVFDGSVQVCLNYDDSNLNTNRESKLILSHYECDAAGNNCSWVDITDPGFPDVDANQVCGTTSSFSIFALLEPKDTDGDGVDDVNDNCIATVNPDQADTDGDGIGDACEIDTDNDGIDDDADNCVFDINPDQSDVDRDGLGDVCDADLDGDGVDNSIDNCPIAANPNQADFDQDGSGDACDLDDDADGFPDAEDECQGTAIGVPTDNSGCSSSQGFELECPVAGEWKNHGAYVSCVSKEANFQVSIGLISNSEKDAVVSEAAKSDVGKKED